MEKETVHLFSSDCKSHLGLGFLDFSEPPLPSPPPCVELISSEVSTSLKYSLEPVNLGDLTLLKGRVSTEEVFGLAKSDLVPGKYEGGLKLWEGSLDLIKSLQFEIQDSQLNIMGKRVLELGCGHGLPGIFGLLKGAALVHFQDFNVEVLQCLTIPNVRANLPNGSQSLDSIATKKKCHAEIRYFGGDWRDVDQLLSLPQNDRDFNPAVGYDVILMAETVYSISSFQNLYKLLKKCLSRPHGVVYMAGKKYYFGVGGGTRQFLSVVEKDGVMVANMVTEVTDGSSNVREVWKLSLK